MPGAGAARGEVRAALGHARPESVRQLAHKARLRDVERVPEALVRGLGVAMAQVLGNGAREEPRLLGHVGYAAAQVGLGEPAHVNAAEAQAAAPWRR